MERLRCWKVVQTCRRNRVLDGFKRPSGAIKATGRAEIQVFASYSRFAPVAIAWILGGGVVFWAESEDPGPHVDDFHRPLSLKSTGVFLCGFVFTK